MELWKKLLLSKVSTGLVSEDKAGLQRGGEGGRILGSPRYCESITSFSHDTE